MAKYSSKEMIEELLQFLIRSQKKSILIEEYIQKTQNKFKWSQKRVIALYKAIHESKAIVLDYMPVKKGTSVVSCVRVKRT